MIFDTLQIDSMCIYKTNRILNPKEIQCVYTSDLFLESHSNTILLAQQGFVTGIVVVIIIVSVTALAYAYVTAAVPGHVTAAATVVAGATPPTALIVVLPIVRVMCAATANAANAATTANAAAVYDVEHSTARVGAIW